MKKRVAEILSQLIQKHYDIQVPDIQLDTPPDKKLGDIAFGCFVLARELKKSPAIIAEEIAEICSNIKEFSLVQVSGPYLNISLSDDIFFKALQEYSIPKYEKKDESIVIDYIGANVGKPLHIGHMCTPNQGQVMIEVYKKLGYNVISDSHIGDWGIIFGKLITAYKKYGDEQKLSENAVDHLFELYVKISADAKEDAALEEEFRKEFKDLASGNTESIQLWSQFTAHSIEAMNTQLARLGVKPDYDIGESFYEGIGLPKTGDYPDLKYDMKSIVAELVEKGIASQNDDGSVGVVFEDELKVPSCILQKRDGSHGYLASDLSALKYRGENWNPQKIIYFLDVRQKLHLQQAFIIAQRAGWLGETELIHAHNGFISLKDGAMSTREGRIIRLDDLLDEAEQRAKNLILTKRTDFSPEELNNLSKIIGMGAIKYGYLKKSRETDIVFDWDEFMSFEGNSGPYIQYGYVRAKNILNQIPDNITLKESVVFTQEAKELIGLITEYHHKLNETSQKNMPHILCGYAYELTKVFSSFYSHSPIINEPDEGMRNVRVMITKMYHDVLKDVFDLLVIPLPDKM
ncbi:arginine--tRNA ligase [Candidatus Gracilibacteria bacterium]|nr:arginine--tRNA ligase [Candidatus Gracilibacteria bacterium]